MFLCLWILMCVWSDCERLPCLFARATFNRTTLWTDLSLAWLGYDWQRLLHPSAHRTKLSQHLTGIYNQFIQLSWKKGFKFSMTFQRVWCLCQVSTVRKYQTSTRMDWTSKSIMNFVRNELRRLWDRWVTKIPSCCVRGLESMCGLISFFKNFQKRIVVQM